MAKNPSYDFPHGYALSESALYAFTCQDVFPDTLSFAAAIPDNLKPIFLIPIRLEIASSRSAVAHNIANHRCADGYTPSGGTEEGDLFGTKTFTYEDNTPTVPSSESGSIFQVDDADDITKHQEYNYDQNVQEPSDTSYMSDVDVTEDGFDYPYRTNQEVRHSSVKQPNVVVFKLRVALKPEQLEIHTPKKIKDNAESCTVSLVSYDKKTKVFTFSADCGNGKKQVQAKLSDIDQIAMSCNCPFWRWNGPEYHAVQKSYMLDSPFGSATAPNERDPDRKYWLCKHTYAVLRRMDFFVQEIIDENWDKDDSELLDEVDNEWDRLEGAVEIPIEDIDEDDLDLEIDWDVNESPEGLEEGEVDVDLSDLESDHDDEDYEESADDEPPPEEDYQVEEDLPTPEEEDYQVEEEPSPEEDYEEIEELPEEDYEEIVEEEPKPEPEEDPEIEVEEPEESDEDYDVSKDEIDLED